MPKSLEDLKKALEAMQGGSEFVDVLNTTLTTEKSAREAAENLAKEEKQRGITEVNKRNKEAEGLRKFKIAFETLGYNSEDSTLDDFLEGITEKIKGGGGNGKGQGDLPPEVRELQKTMKKLEKDLTTTRTELESERAKANELKSKTFKSTMRSALLTALNEKVYGADLLADTLISSGKVKLDVDESTVLFVEGDNTLEFDEGVKKLLETRKDIIKNSQQAGGGSGGSGGDSNKNKTPAERTKELRNMGRALTL